MRPKQGHFKDFAKNILKFGQTHILQFYPMEVVKIKTDCGEIEIKTAAKYVKQM